MPTNDEEQLKEESAQPAEGCTLYVAGLSDGVDDKDLEEVFSKYGKVVKASGKASESQKLFLTASGQRSKRKTL